MDPSSLPLCADNCSFLFPFPFDSLTTLDILSYVYAFLSPFILMDNSSTFLFGFSRNSLDCVPIPFPSFSPCALQRLGDVFSMWSPHGFLIVLSGQPHLHADLLLEVFHTCGTTLDYGVHLALPAPCSGIPLCHYALFILLYVPLTYTLHLSYTALPPLSCIQLDLHLIRAKVHLFP